LGFTTPPIAIATTNTTVFFVCRVVDKSGDVANVWAELERELLLLEEGGGGSGGGGEEVVR
jgi:hypothetical protein